MNNKIINLHKYLTDPINLYNFKREFKPGIVLIRILRSLVAFHYGILIDPNYIDIYDSRVIDWSTDDKVHYYTLREFMDGESVLWIENWYDDPVDLLSSKRPDIDVVIEALSYYIQYKQNKMSLDAYSIQDNNCENFVRRCVFTDKNNHISRQIEKIAIDGKTVWTRLGILFASNMIFGDKILSDRKLIIKPKNRQGYKIE